MSEAIAPSSTPSRKPVIRRLVASAASLGLAAILLQVLLADTHGVQGWMWFVVVTLIAAPAVAAAAIWTPYLGLQLLARAYWWNQLLYACLVAVAGASSVRVAAMAVGSACALLLVGRAGLDPDSGRFRPVAFRGTLMLMLVLAIADAGTFTWVGVMRLSDGIVGLILFAPPMIAAVIGLLRLRTWGVLVSVGCNLVVAVLAATNRLYLSSQVRWLFFASAIVQLLIPLPIWITIIRRRPPPPDRWQAARRIGATVVIVALAAACVIATIASQRY